MKIALITLLTVFRVAFVGDPQVDNKTELDYARKSIFAELLERKDLDMVVIMGDLVNENPSLMPVCEAILDSLNCPWIRVHGNHDGKQIPNDTTYCIRGLNFVILNREDSPMPNRSVAKTVYLSHYPFKEVVDSSSNSLYLSAHLHQVFREKKGAAEHIGVGATCGTWWRGEKDEFGIPYALMNCGSPRGYFIADFDINKKQWYKLSYKVVQRPKSLQADAFVDYDDSISSNASVMSNNSPDFTSTATNVIQNHNARVFINVYGGAEDGILEVFLNGKWVQAQRVDEVDYKVRQIIKSNKTKDRAWRKQNRDIYMPMRRINSKHLWAISVDGIEKKEYLQVRYKDSSMNFKIKRLKISK